MASQLVAVRRANERVLLSAMIPPPSAPALISRVSTARQGTTAMKLVFEEMAAFDPIRSGSAEGTDQFFRGISSSRCAAKAVVHRKTRAANARMRFIQSPIFVLLLRSELGFQLVDAAREAFHLIAQRFDRGQRHALDIESRDRGVGAEAEESVEVLGHGADIALPRVVVLVAPARDRKRGEFGENLLAVDIPEVFLAVAIRHAGPRRSVGGERHARRQPRVAVEDRAAGGA